MLEHQHQCALIRWADMAAANQPELRLLHAIPNAAVRSPRQGAAMKREGLRPGCHDLALPVPRGGYGGLYIKLKRPASPGKPKGALSGEQRDWLQMLALAGNRVEVCWGWEQAREAIERYLRLRKAG